MVWLVLLFQIVIDWTQERTKWWQTNQRTGSSRGWVSLLWFAKRKQKTNYPRRPHARSGPPGCRIRQEKPSIRLDQKVRRQSSHTISSQEEIKRQSPILQIGWAIERSHRTSGGTVWGLANGGVGGRIWTIAISFETDKVANQFWLFLGWKVTIQRTCYWNYG